MKRILLYTILFFFFTSCLQNMGNIGPIFGKWQLKELQTESKTVVYDSIFYNFQRKYIYLQKLAEIPHVVYHNVGYFIRTDDELMLDIRDCAIERIGIYQLPDTTATFKVLELSNKKMVLRLGEDSIYTFRKAGRY